MHYKLKAAIIGLYVGGNLILGGELYSHGFKDGRDASDVEALQVYTDFAKQHHVALHFKGLHNTPSGNGKYYLHNTHASVWDVVDKGQ